MASLLHSLLERRGPRGDAGRKLWVLLALVALFVGARCLFLEADPPIELPGGYRLRELVVEPVAKASEARNKVLFGQWSPNPADEYQFWRPQSPVWVYPLTGFFELFGVGIGQLRAFAILYTAIGYLALLAIAWQRLRGIEFVAAALFPALDAVHIVYSRSGLLEPAVNAWLSVAVLFVLLARRHWVYLLGAQWAFVAAFFTKGAAVYAFPLIGIASLWLVWRSPGARQKWRARAVVSAHAVVLGALALAYVQSDFYMRTMIWNVNHMLLDRNEGGAFLVDWRSIHKVFRGALDGEKFLRMGIAVPVTGPLALLELAAVLFALGRRKVIDPWRVIVAGWFLCAVVTLLLIKDLALRFDTILPAPAALAGASAIRTLARLRPRQRFALRRTAVAVALALFGSFNAWMFQQLFQERKYEVVEASRALTRIIGPRRAAIIGYWSAPAVFSTPYEHYYVKDHFNTSPRALEQLRITHFLYVVAGGFKERTGAVVKKYYPEAARGVQPALRLPMLGVTLALYELEGGLGPARVQGGRGRRGPRER